MSNRSLMILIAGPYRSGTGDDPELMARNLRGLESVALPLYRAGHIPLIGESILYHRSSSGSGAEILKVETLSDRLGYHSVRCCPAAPRRLRVLKKIDLRDRAAQSDGTWQRAKPERRYDRGNWCRPCLTLQR